MNTKFRIPPKTNTIGNALPELADRAEAAPQKPLSDSLRGDLTAGSSGYSQPPENAVTGSPERNSLDNFEGLGQKYLVPDSRRKPDSAKVTAQYHLRLTPPQAEIVEAAFEKSGYRFKSEWLRTVFFRGLELEERLKS